MFNHRLMVELASRLSGIPFNQRYCSFCPKIGFNYIEDEYHLISTCYTYQDLRQQYLRDIINGQHAHFITVMQSKNPEIISRLACFTYQAFRQRSVV